jgi:hypothetical protein
MRIFSNGSWEIRISGRDTDDPRRVLDGALLLFRDIIGGLAMTDEEYQREERALIERIQGNKKD